MENNYQITINTRDRILRAWENSMELVRDFEMYSKAIRDDEEAADLMGKFAEDEGIHASKLLDLLHKYEND